VIRRSDLQHAQLSLEDLDDIALRLRMRSLRGDLTAGAVAKALESVVVRRQHAQLVRDRKSSGFVSSAWQRVSAWAITRQ
jgi:hypothetical protein